MSPVRTRSGGEHGDQKQGDEVKVESKDGASTMEALNLVLTRLQKMEDHNDKMFGMLEESVFELRQEMVEVRKERNVVPLGGPAKVKEKTCTPQSVTRQPVAGREAVSEMFSAELPACNLDGLKLKLEESGKLKAATNWQPWLQEIQNALAGAGWVHGQPLSRIGEGRLAVTINRNVTEAIRNQIVGFPDGSSKLTHLSLAYSKPTVLAQLSVVKRLMELKLTKGEDPAWFVGEFSRLVNECRAVEPHSDRYFVMSFLIKVEDVARQWAHRKTEAYALDPSSYTLHRIYDEFLQETQSWAPRKHGLFALQEDRKVPPWVTPDTLCNKCGKRGHIKRFCTGKPNAERVKKLRDEDRIKHAREKGSRTTHRDMNDNSAKSFSVDSTQPSVNELVDKLHEKWQNGGASFWVAPSSTRVHFCFGSCSKDQSAEWLWDTGSDVHITNNVQDLHDVVEIQDRKLSIQTGGGMIYPTHAGRAKVKFTGPNGKGAVECNLELVLVVPSMPLKIVSGLCFLRRGGALVKQTLFLPDGTPMTDLNFERRGCFLWRYGTEEPQLNNAGLHRATVMSGATEDVKKLFADMVRCAVKGRVSELDDAALKTLILWHRRLAHCSAERLRWTVERTTGIQVDPAVVTVIPCEACDQAKITKIPSHDPFPVAGYAGESIHFDLGSIKPVSVEGFRYFELRTDLFSRLREITFHKLKSDVVTSMQRAIEGRNRQLNQSHVSGRAVKNVHIDGARELTNEGVSTNLSAFETFCQNRHINLTISAPQNHHQNPYSERGIRVLQDAARAMSIQMRVPSVFWNHLLDAAAHITNRTGTRSLQGNIPLQVFRKDIEGLDSYPDIGVTHLRIIGCVCTVYVEETERVRSEKLEARGVKGILLGFAGEHNYVVWLLEGGRLLRTPNVIFAEDLGCIGGGGEPSYPNPRDVVRSLPPAVQKRLRHRALPKSNIRSKDLNQVEEDVTDPEDGQIRPKRGRPRRTPLQVYQHNWDLVNGYRCEAPMEDLAIYQQLLADHTVNAGTSLFDRLPTLRQAMKGIEWPHWREAMMAEIKQLLELGTFQFKQNVRPQNIVTAKWVLLKKLKVDGTLERFKARLVARGFTQQEGVDYTETSASTARTASWRMLIAMAAVRQWAVIQTDFVGAYLHGDLEETIYMAQFELLDEFFRAHPDQITKYQWTSSAIILLRKPLYGLKQGGANWQKKIKGLLAEQCMHPLPSDSAVYKLHDSKTTTRVLAATHVDDFLWVTNDRAKVHEILEQLREHIDCSENEAEWFLGVQLLRHSEAAEISLSHGPYVNRILADLQMTDCRPSQVPMDPGLVAVTSDSSSEKGGNSITPTQLLTVNGKVMYTACIARPDLAFTASYWARFAHCPTTQHLEGVKQAVRYLKGSSNLAITYRRDHRHTAYGELGVHGVVDASFASDLGTSKSTSGYVFFVAGAPVLWRSAIQTVVALSSTEAEFNAIFEAVREAAWIKKVLEEMGEKVDEPLPLLNDNTGALAWCQEAGTASRKKRHMRIRHDYVKQEIDLGVVRLSFVESLGCAADILTKPLHRVKHQAALELLGLERVTSQTRTESVVAGEGLAAQ